MPKAGEADAAGGIPVGGVPVISACPAPGQLVRSVPEQATRVVAQELKQIVDLVEVAAEMQRREPQGEATVQELAQSLASKASHTLVSTKRHVNAVTDQMVGTMRSWSDSDGFAIALADTECAAVRREYLRKHRREK